MGNEENVLRRESVLQRSPGQHSERALWLKALYHKTSYMVKAEKLGELSTPCLATEPVKPFAVLPT